MHGYKLNVVLAPVFGQLSCQSTVHFMLDHKMLRKPLDPQKACADFSVLSVRSRPSVSDTVRIWGRDGVVPSPNRVSGYVRPVARWMTWHQSSYRGHHTAPGPLERSREGTC